MSTPDSAGGEREERDKDAAEIDAAFAELVAGWDAEPSWEQAEREAGAATARSSTAPSTDERTTDPDEDDAQGHGPAGAEPSPAEPEQPGVATTEPPVSRPARVVRPDELDLDEDEDEGHYEPPEPPPIPRPHGAGLGALVLLAIGVVLLFIPGVIGLTDSVGFPLGLLAMASSLFWMFLLLRDGPPVDSGWDDGSRI
ncbi:hypothetical protein [Rhodococcus sp. X156]|uniref:hypothetical protein n=1 Tax=Rhodococcus sp. X156 TaxID=2499145 RepID=UPI000FD6EE41|nr:hypothetical protein [Rhodococcus sp. X156]